MSGSDWGRHSKSCCKTPLGSMAVSAAWQISRRPATSSTTGVWNVLCLHISTAEEVMRVMRECDIHRTRSIKTNSGVHLSCTPGLDLCCDLLHHLQGVPRTCSFWVFTSYTYIDFAPPHHLSSLSYIWNVTRSNSRIMWMAVFAQFCFILFNM